LKKIIILILLSFSFYTIIFAQTQKELFDEGINLFKSARYQQAVDKFSELIKLAPGNADAYKNRGVTYMKQTKFDLAIEDFEKAKELFPELKGLYSNLGVAWYYKKDYNKAIENYDIEINMSPQSSVAYFNRALCLAELDRNEDALDDLEQTLKLKPDFYWAICYKADLLAQAGKDIQAVGIYEEAINLDSKNTYAKEKLALLKEQIKEKNKGKEIEELIQEMNTPENKKAPESGYAIQAGAFLNQDNANKMETRLKNNGFDSRILILQDSKDRTWYLVRSGNYTNENEAKKAIVSLKDKLAIQSIVRSKGVW
jgi:tetratricopeptide (TPR) repeat protein